MSRSGIKCDGCGDYLSSGSSAQMAKSGSGKNICPLCYGSDSDPQIVAKDLANIEKRVAEVNVFDLHCRGAVFTVYVRRDIGWEVECGEFGIVGFGDSLEETFGSFENCVLEEVSDAHLSLKGGKATKVGG